MIIDAKRVGIGEQGEPATLNNLASDLNKELFAKHIFNALLSDAISVNRSLPDVRPRECKTKLYLKKLPMVSIIVIFFNEHKSVLLRSVHSLINRSPPELVKEIILVDDFSDLDSLHKSLDDYIAQHFTKVRILRLNERSGLIRARMAGARIAKAEVLVFMDSHIEAGYNWLPPLLEPIVLNSRTVMGPTIDFINGTQFFYGKYDYGMRGIFDFSLRYLKTSRLPEDQKHPSEPFKNLIMMGGSVVISAKFFWELGGYDEGLDIYGGEQFDLSFKIWMCGGQLYEAPCSRVAHLSRSSHLHLYNTKNVTVTKYIYRNYKRVAEVWMDDYKKYVSMRMGSSYRRANPGDLTLARALRSKCKPFKWFLQNVAYDVMKRFPPIKPPNYAYGAIRNVAEPDMCVDAHPITNGNHVDLEQCAEAVPQSNSSQFWELTAYRDLRLASKDFCLEVRAPQYITSLWIWRCHYQGRNQYWLYDFQAKLLKQVFKNTTRCLEMLPHTKQLIINQCNSSNRYMQWTFSFNNPNALGNNQNNYSIQSA
ncbi:N-acetylgalactosaminyltransferase 6-like [Scaptodrosophila lebanonensis]|uniref:Polypeptide N-acetylgalactosaminyltransferase n=1 Tax=Drosophila lebanonensis TaxID=7225 RepID=A0A6J2UJ74_DROLE|nr:N-acetylgalactosaminyltransferase 6-like [Scaptodrosophila lebanonensis]